MFPQKVDSNNIVITISASNLHYTYKPNSPPSCHIIFQNLTQKHVLKTRKRQQCASIILM